MFESSYLGHVDKWSPSLSGWVIDSLIPESPVQLVVLVDGKMVSKVVADLERPDVEEAGFQSRNCGFLIRLDELYSDTDVHTVSLVEQSSGQEIFSSPTRICFGSRGPIISRADVGRKTVRSVFGNFELVREACQSLGQVALLSTYRPEGARQVLVRDLVKELRRVGFVVVVIDSSPVRPDDDLAADVVVWRQNLGHDFGSWYCGLDLIENVGNLNSLLLLNDSCYGPFTSLQLLMDEILGSDSDVTSLTDGWFGGFHLQSNFLLFKNRSIAENALEQFFSEFEFPRLKADLVRLGEIGLSKYLLRNGFKIEARFSYEQVVQEFLSSLNSRSVEELTVESADRSISLPNSFENPKVAWRRSIMESILSGRPLNLTHTFWDVLLDMGMPFIKRDLLTSNPLGLPNLQKVGTLLLENFGFSSFEEINHDLRIRGQRALWLATDTRSD